MQHRLLTLAVILGVTAAFASTAHASDGSQSQPQSDNHYVVAAGDNLSSIAEQFKLDTWIPIWNVNTAMIDPDLIHVGDELIIPSGVTTNRPLPVAVQASVAPVAASPVSYGAATPRRAAQATANYVGGSAGIFERIRARESGGNYATNTGNGYYGAYQYDLGTWGNYGGYARPDLAPPAVQDARAAQTYAARGCSPWPNTCY